MTTKEKRNNIIRVINSHPIISEEKARKELREWVSNQSDEYIDRKYPKWKEYYTRLGIENL